MFLCWTKFGKIYTIFLCCTKFGELYLYIFWGNISQNLVIGIFSREGYD